MNTPNRYICVECGGEKVKAVLWAQSAPRFYLSRFPLKTFALWSPKSAVSAMVCKTCGLTTLYAEDPDELTQ